jgi:hypothetical protein
MSYGLSDAIKIDADTGYNNAGNGGNAYNEGDLNTYSNINFEPTQRVYGAEVDAHAGDFVHQNGEWEAGRGGAGDGGFGLSFSGEGGGITGGGGPGGAGGSSNGGLGSTSGGDVAAVSAATTGTMTNYLAADQHASFVGAIGGNGGNGNLARGGDISAAVVHTNPETEITNHNIAVSLEDSLNHNHVDLGYGLPGLMA